MLAAVLAGSISSGNLNAQDSVSLTWNPPSGGGSVSGYALYAGVLGGPFTQRMDVGMNTTVTVTGLPAGQTNCFVVAAYDVLGIESQVSNEAQFATPTNKIVPTSPPPFTPPSLQITNNGRVLITSAGVPNQTCLLQDSTNLTDWSFVFTNATGGALGYTVPIPSGASWRFYRGLTVIGAVNASSVASALSNQNFSANAVGFVKIAAAHGNTLLANPFDSGNNTLAALLPTMPSGTVIYKYTTSSEYTSNLFTGGHWTDGAMTLDPGEGCFLYNPAKTTQKLLFAGEVLQGNITNFIPVGYSIISPAIPLPNALATLPGTSGDVIQCYSGRWLDYTNVFGAWVGNSRRPPLEVNPGGAFFIFKQAAADWVQTFSPAD